MENVYKIVHYYDLDLADSCFFLKSKFSAEEMIKILATVQFRYEDLVAEDRDFESKNMIKLLERFYPIKNVTEEYKNYMQFTILHKDKWAIVNEFIIGLETIIQIDLYAARESCCGREYFKLVEQELPQSKEYVEEILKLQAVI